MKWDPVSVPGILQLRGLRKKAGDKSVLVVVIKTGNAIGLTPRHDQISVDRIQEVVTGGRASPYLKYALHLVQRGMKARIILSNQGSIYAQVLPGLGRGDRQPIRTVR
ncbi:hypothetical protein, partial [Thiolapillus sp.]